MNVEVSLTDADLDKLALKIAALWDKRETKKAEPKPNEFTLPADGFISVDQFAKVMGIGISTVWDQIRCGRYPKPYKITPNRSGFAVSDVRALIEKIKNHVPLTGEEKKGESK